MSCPKCSSGRHAVLQRFVEQARRAVLQCIDCRNIYVSSKAPPLNEVEQAAYDTLRTVYQYLTSGKKIGPGEFGEIVGDVRESLAKFEAHLYGPTGYQKRILKL